MSKDIKPQRVVFDYNKLAEAIVRAEQKVKSEENKIDDTSYFLKVLLVVSFVGVSAFLWIFFISSIYVRYIGEIMPQNVLENIAYMGIVVVSLGYAVVTSVLTYKIWKITDRSYLINYFAAITGLLALVISLLDFFKR